jgi:hypothetical protein
MDVAGFIQTHDSVGQLPVGRQTLPWDYFRVARQPPDGTFVGAEVSARS